MRSSPEVPHVFRSAISTKSVGYLLCTNLQNLPAVIPAKAEALHNSEAGQSIFAFTAEQMDSRFRGNDGIMVPA
jgi:hypothetical protein